MTKKTRKTESGTPEGKPGSPVMPQHMAEEVAAAVEITGIRLFASRVQSGNINDRAELSLGFRAQVKPTENGGTFLVSIDFLLRDGDPKVEPTPEEPTRLDIRATFLLNYRLREGSSFSDEHLVAFSQTNGVYNAWPYWREYVSSTLARMGMHSITLPVFRLASKPSQSADDPAKS